MEAVRGVAAGRWLSGAGVIIVLALLLLVCSDPHHHRPSSVDRARLIPCKPRAPPTKLLTLFTTVKSSDAKWHIEKNVVENWSLLRERVNLILYHTEPSTSAVGAQLRQLALNNGWTVRRAPFTLHGLPVLRSLFLDATKLYDTPYYAYSNSDVLFTDSLTDTLEALHGYRFSDVLMVGRRTNYDVSHGERLVEWDHVRDKAETNATLFRGFAQDYFISTRFGYPWRTLHNFVVGRIGYDNWLITNAILKDIPVVDLTDTVLALHQTDAKGNFEGQSKTAQDNVDVNYAIAGHDYPYVDFYLGNTDCAQLCSGFHSHNNDSHISLQFRLRVKCAIGYRKLHKNYKLFRYAISNKTCVWRDNS